MTQLVIALVVMLGVATLYPTPVTPPASTGRADVRICGDGTPPPPPPPPTEDTP